jgi:hypothetical protein
MSGQPIDRALSAPLDLGSTDARRSPIRSGRGGFSAASASLSLPSGGGCTVRTEGNKEGKVLELLGRESVFAEVTDFAYASATPGHRSPPARKSASPWQERSASDDSPPATAPRRRFPSPDTRWWAGVPCRGRRSGGRGRGIGGRAVETSGPYRRMTWRISFSFSFHP